VGARFSTPVKTGYRVSFSGVKRPGSAADRPFPSSTDVQYGSSLHLCPLTTVPTWNATWLQRWRRKHWHVTMKYPLILSPIT